MASTQDTLKNDPFIALWKNNYNENLRSGAFSSERSKPLIYILNTMPYSNIPILLVAAGPSLERNIQVIKEHADKFLIICADVVLYRLMEEGILPDLVVNIDPHESISRFWGGLDTSQLTFVCPTTVNPKALGEWKGRILFFNQVDIPGTPKGNALKRLIVPTGGFGSLFNRFFVGATMLQVSQILRPSKVFLAGYDFGFTGGKPYCEGFLDRKLINLAAPEGSPEWESWMNVLKANEVKKELEITINASETIWTTNLLNFYKNTFISLSRALKLNVINTTEGGILRELPLLTLLEAIEKYCQSPIQRKDLFSPVSRGRKRLKKH